MGFSDDFNRSDRPIHGDPIPGTGLVWRDWLQQHGCDFEGYGEIVSNALTAKSGTNHESQSVAYVDVGTPFIDLQYTWRFTGSTSGAQCTTIGGFLGLYVNPEANPCSNPTEVGVFLAAQALSLGFPATWSALFWGTALSTTPTWFPLGLVSLGSLTTGVDYAFRLRLNEDLQILGQLAGTTVFSGQIDADVWTAMQQANATGVAVNQIATDTATGGVPVASRHTIDDLTVSAYDPTPEFDGDTALGAFTPKSKRSWQERVPTAYYNPDTDAAYPTDGPYKPGRVT